MVFFFLAKMVYILFSKHRFICGKPFLILGCLVYIIASVRPVWGSFYVLICPASRLVLKMVLRTCCSSFQLRWSMFSSLNLGSSMVSHFVIKGSLVYIIASVGHVRVSSFMSCSGPEVDWSS